MTKKNKKWLILLGVLVILFFSSQFIINHIVNNRVQFQLQKINAKGRVQVTVNNVKLNLIESNLILQNVKFSPNETYFENFKKGKSQKAIAGSFSLSKLKIKGFSILRILFSKEISTHQIIVEGLDLTLFKNETHQANKDKPEKRQIILDSLFVKGIHKINLGSIEVNDFKVKILNSNNNDTLFQYSEEELLIDGIGFEPIENAPQYFRLHKNNLNIHLKNQQIALNGGNYNIIFNQVDYNFQHKLLEIANFKLKPTESKAKLAASYTYNSEVFDVAIKKIQVHGIYIDTIVRTGTITIDSINVNGLNLEIYKDQTKPFNLNKRPLFLNQKLKQLKHPLNIEKFTINQGQFLYEEKHPEKDELMTVNIFDLKASLEHITSIKDSFNTEKELAIQVQGKINNTAPVHLQIKMPYNSYSNSFTIKGEVGSAKFSDFNSAIYPALGAKIESGNLISATFNAYGNPEGTKGSMTMIYKDLNANFIKSKEKHEGEEKKALSWITNSVILSENPSPKGKLKVALIEAERVPYKGFGNLVWKTFMSGMMNTLLPTGKKIKDSKIEKEEQREAKREARKAAKNKD